MTIKIEVLEGESIASAVIRFRKKVHQNGIRSWYKSRVGYYEKPSIKRRRKRRLAWINGQCFAADKSPLKMKMGINWLYERKRPFP
jgi:ribosomal protein S21